MKNVLMIGDPHCGHLFGLRNPGFMKYKVDSKADKLCDAAFSTFMRMAEKHAPYDVLLCLGDIVEGTGPKSGGTELLTTSQLGQVEIFVDVLEQIRPFFKSKAPPPMELVYGTGYHVSSGGEDWDDVFAKHTDAGKLFQIHAPGAHSWVEIGGVTYDLKHHVGRSSTPYGQWTPVARAAVWNDLWNMRGGQPKSDILCRGHVHYHVFGGYQGKLFMTAPCLCWNSKFGSRRCDEIIDWGLTWFQCEKGVYDWGTDLAVLDGMKPKVRILR